MKTNKLFRRTKLATSVSLVIAAMGAQAQESASAATEAASNDILEEISVHGIRRSLQDSMAVKMSSDSIVEAVSAEDIGKLPDVSIAESLARLPGLAAQRLNGRSQVISIRGLAPDFSTALLNGRQQVSTGDNRSVEYDQYPSELLSGAVVYKTPDASLIGQGLAGTVDMRTIRPLEYGKRAVAANVRHEWNQLDALNDDAEDSGERYTLSYIDQFANNTIGIALGYASMETPTQGERFNAWGYPDAYQHAYTDALGNVRDARTSSSSENVLTDLGPDGVEGTADDVFTDIPGTHIGRVIGGAKPFVQSNTLERDAFVGVVEFAPNDAIHTAVDLFYSDYKETQLLRGIEFPLLFSSASLEPGYTVGNGMITSGTFTGVRGVMRNDLEERESKLFAVGWNTQYAINDSWMVTADLSYSENDRVDKILENYAGINADETLSFSSSKKGTVFTPTLDYRDTSAVRITSPQGWGADFVPTGGQKGYYKQPASTDELTQIRFSAERDLAFEFLTEIEFGVNFDTREKTKTTSPEYYFALPGGALSAPLPSSTGVTDLGFLGIPGMVSYDPLDAFNSGIYELVPGLRSDIAAKTWTVEEDIITAYVQLGLESQLGSIPISGNIGLQVIDTDQSSKALSAQGSAGTLVTVPVSGGKSYTDVLPSLNVNFEVGEQKFVRLGAARTLARPRMDELRASSEFSLSTEAARLVSTDINFSPWSASGGNPELDPWVANSFDLSYEQYFQDGMGYFAVAAFYKDLKSYIVKEEEVMDFSGFPTGGLSPALNVGLATVFKNGEGGSIDGVELSLSLVGEMFTPVLAGFGTTFSASFTNSKIEPENTPEQALPGLSKDVYNLTVYYEKYGFSARVSGRHRSEFLGELAGFDARRVQRMVDEETLVDAQLSYSFDSGSFEGMTVLLQGNNLTDEPFVTTEEGNARRVVDYQRYGRTFALGLSYKY